MKTTNVRKNVIEVKEFLDKDAEKDLLSKTLIFDRKSLKLISASK